MFLSIGLLVVLVSPALASGVIVYPAKGQSAEQQQKDEGECMSWASQQTGFNPTAPIQATTPPPATAAPTARAGKGMLRGALVGTAAGAIAGDTGKGAAIGAASGGLFGGMRRRDQAAASQQQQEAWADQQAAQYAQKQSDFNRAYAACLKGRGYTVD
jgi:hypothetical protein